MSEIIQTTVYLLRHGKVNGLPALYGNTDVDVTDEINSQILNDLNRLQKNLNQNKITQVISSPLLRCYKVAKQFSTANNIAFEAITNFKEMNFGELDGVSFDEIKASKTGDKIWQQLEAFWHNPNKHPLPEAELLFNFYQRVKYAWDTLLTKHQGKNILLICHGGVIRMILSYLLNIDHGNKSLFSNLTIKNNSLTIIRSLNEKTFKNANNQTKAHNNVVTISTPLKCVSQNTKEFR